MSKRCKRSKLRLAKAAKQGVEHLGDFGVVTLEREVFRFGQETEVSR
jgi:hypothetical protein